MKDLEIVARTLFGGPSTTDYIPPLPFREVSIRKKLKFGYYTSGMILMRHVGAYGAHQVHNRQLHQSLAGLQARCGRDCRSAPESRARVCGI